MILDKVLELDIIPDIILRFGIRHLLKKRLAICEKLYRDPSWETKFTEELKAGPIALSTDQANKQHYEVPSEFYELVLGENLKYSSGYWEKSSSNLSQAEINMLNLTCQRAGVEDGQQILDLGCGWGSLSLYIARKYKNVTITSISNSKTQKAFIDKIAKEEELPIKTITKNVNEGKLDGTFDRIISIEMFEHMRNYETLLRQCSECLTSTGKLFVHIFGHKKFTYPFEISKASDWMGRYFFENGLMPSQHLLSRFNNNIKIQKSWVNSGEHYKKTCDEWLKNMDKNIQEVRPILKKTYGPSAKKFESYWRIFFMSCSELFGYKKGSEWQVYHYLFEKI